MCIIHEPSLHYLFQDLLLSFQQSKTLSPLFLRRVGCLLCTCQKDFLYESKNIIETQRSLYKWFEEKCQTNQNLTHFKSIVDTFRANGSIDSGTKITLLTLIKDIDELNFSKLRSVNSKNSNRKNIFFAKLIRLKFDLKLCSAKEFVDLLNKIDNSAIRYIKLTTKTKITFRDMDHLTVRNFMGELEATLESRNEKNLKSAEFYLKRLADAVHYRLAKQIPSSDTMVGCGSLNSLKILLQSPPESETDDSLLYSSNTSDKYISSANVSLEIKDSMNEDSKKSMDASQSSQTSNSILSPSAKKSKYRKPKNKIQKEKQNGDDAKPNGEEKSPKSKNTKSNKNHSNVSIKSTESLTKKNQMNSFNTSNKSIKCQ